MNWNASSGITPTDYYEYCYDTSDNDECNSTWKNVGVYRSADLRGLRPEGDYYWQARAVNDFGATYSNHGNWYSFTVDALDAATFHSTAANDGWTLESSETGNRGSTKNNAGILRLGDDSRNRQYRSILSFDTSSMPNDAVLVSVVLRIKRAGGTSPSLLTTHGNLVADMAKGIFGLASLEVSDFQKAGAPINTAGYFNDAGGSWYELNLSPAGFKYINLAGMTQFRLRFAKDDDNDRLMDIDTFYAGDNALDQPQLIIEYTVP